MTNIEELTKATEDAIEAASWSEHPTPPEIAAQDPTKYRAWEGQAGSARMLVVVFEMGGKERYDGTITIGTTVIRLLPSLAQKAVEAARA